MSEALQVVRCSGCDAPVQDDTPYCLSCGRLLDWGCPRCGHSNRAGDFACNHCSYRRLAPENAISAPVEAGERKFVTILFADIAGSFEWIAERDPEQVDTMLSLVFEAMRRSVHEFGGTVSRVIGDGIMALFGAPMSIEDHAVRACHAALAIRDAALGSFQQFGAGAPPRLRIGLSSGEVIFRSVASDTATNYDAFGEPVHLAARMEQLAAPGTVRISQTTQRLASGYFEFQTLGETTVKGLAQPVQTYLLVRKLAGRTRLHAGAERGFSPLVGRERELQQFTRARDVADAGTTQVVGVVADAGYGKSRLLLELLNDLPQHWRICQSTAFPFGQGGYRTVRELLTSLLGLSLDADEASLAEILRMALEHQGLQGLITPMTALFRLPVAEAEWHHLDALSQTRQIQHAVLEFLGHVCSDHSLLIAVEDLHWIDADSEALLDRLARTISTGRLLIAVTYRPEYKAPWADLSCSTVIALTRLSDAQIGMMLRSLVLPGPDFEAIETLVVRRVEGNPFFLEESLSSFVDEGVLARAGAGYRVLTAPGDVTVPPTVRALLSARIDRLSQRDKRVLQAASVIGQIVPLETLQELVELDRPLLLACLDRLLDRGLLAPAPDHPEPAWQFRHALTQEATYTGILLRHRAALHATVVRSLEERSSTRQVDQLESLAHHAQKAELWDKSALYAYRAGVEASSRNSNLDAVRFLEQALSALVHWPDGTDRVRLAVDVNLALRYPLLILGRLEDTVARVRAAEPLAASLGDPARLGLFHILHCHIAWLTGKSDAALASGEAALSLGRSSGNAALEMRAQCFQGWIWYSRGEPLRALAWFTPLLAYVKQASTEQQPLMRRYDMAMFLSYAARSLSELGATAEGYEVLAMARRIPQIERNDMASIFLGVAEGHLCLQQDRPEAGLPLLEATYDLCLRPDTRMMEPVSANLLGLAHLRTGRHDTALPLLEESVRKADEMHFRAHHSTRLAALAEGYRAVGRRDQAVAAARAAFTTARRQQGRGSAALALLQLGTALIDRSPLTAERCLRQARRLADALSLSPLARDCNAALSTLDAGRVAEGAGLARTPSSLRFR